MASPSPLQVLEGRDFTPALARAWLGLMDAVWPSPDGPRSFEGTLERLQNQNALHFVRLDGSPDAEGSRMLCHASLFARDMANTEDGAAFRVGCLAGVCVLPEMRGLGWGREVVLAAFEALPEVAPVMLFQTPIPHFYERLGARLVPNLFTNALSPHPEQNPFWEESAMIYPASYPWPQATVDIGGAGF